jgi:peroxiredoxin
MRSIPLFLCMLLPTVLFAQEGAYCIKGKITGLDTPAIAYLAYKKEGRQMADSAFILKGEFELKGTTDEPFPGVVVIDRKGVGLRNLDRRGANDVLKLYVEKGTMLLTGKDSVCKASISGSPLNKDYQQLLAMMKAVDDDHREFSTNIMKATPEQGKAPGFKDSIEHLQASFRARRKQIAEQYIRTNPDAYVSLIALRDYVPDAFPDPDKLEPLFELLSRRVRETPAGKKFLLMLNTIRLVKVGTPAPDFVEKDVTGRQVRLSHLRGSYVLIDFWASWCGPCRQDNPNLVKLYNRFKDKNFTILGVSLDKPEGKAAWLKAIKDDGLTWPQVSDLKGWESGVPKLYGVRAIPQNFIIDREGKIIAANLHGEELQRFVEKLLATQ